MLGQDLHVYCPQTGKYVVRAPAVRTITAQLTVCVSLKCDAHAQRPTVHQKSCMVCSQTAQLAALKKITCARKTQSFQSGAPGKIFKNHNLQIIGERIS